MLAYVATAGLCIIAIFSISTNISLPWWMRYAAKAPRVQQRKWLRTTSLSHRISLHAFTCVHCDRLHWMCCKTRTHLESRYIYIYIYKCIVATILNASHLKISINTSVATHGMESIHRVDSVIESSLREIIESKNFALINMSLNFCETTIYNKVFLENLVAVH